MCQRADDVAFARELLRPAVSLEGILLTALTFQLVLYERAFALPWLAGPFTILIWGTAVSIVLSGLTAGLCLAQLRGAPIHQGYLTTAMSLTIIAPVLIGVSLTVIITI